MKEIVCSKCKKLLLKLTFGQGQIKCKCGELIDFNVVSQKALNEEIYGPDKSSLTA